MKNQIIIDIITALLITLFLYAAVSKLLDTEKFISELKNQPFDNWLAPFIAVGIIALEFIITGLLLSEKTRRTGLICSLSLMILFTGYIGLVLTGYFGRTPCSCGGIISKLSWTQHLFFNLFFVAISLIGIMLSRTGISISKNKKIAFTKSIAQ